MVKKVTWGLIYALCLVALAVVASNIWVVWSTSDKVFSDYRLLPDNTVALVLGTSNKLTDGSPNPYFENRIKTAASLYKGGKVTHFLLSGDNRSKYYNEPMEMKKALVKQGVPDSVITLDYAGLRTLDSIVRSKEIFGQDKITIITQPFHCNRALFISRFYHIDAVAIQAVEPSPEAMVKVYVREYFARTKAIIDLYVLSP
ncbi:MAG TPA: ElyC/SanA/YdcF family protein [Cyclobacteriaceae bacterium]|nr:ElyC/SanA/YdcF family protein [Cyclobacteriaceae bacterium]